MNFSIGKWDIECNLRALRAWSDFRKFKKENGVHYVWGKLSVIIEDGTAEIVRICEWCGEAEVSTISAGDEYWEYCEPCQLVEGGSDYISVREARKRGTI